MIRNFLTLTPASRQLLLLLLSTFFLAPIFANGQSLSAYEVQRAKVNALLAERSSRFGQYDASLNARSGIFGFQTKQDIRNSNEILRNIALTDNAIFQELKVLMDYKDVQSQAIAADAAENNSRMALYRQTIKKLQDQNEELRSKNDAFEQVNTAKNYLLTFLMLGMFGMGYIFYKVRKSERRKARQKI